MPFMFGVLAFASVVVYVVAGSPEPGSRVGIAFGVSAAAVLALVMVYSIRRALPAVRSLGPTRMYLRLHRLGGLLFLLLMIAHTAARVPTGWLMVVLWVVALWVVASGLLGMALQHALPRVLNATGSLEVNLHRIPELVVVLRSRAEAAAALAGARVQAYYAREIAPDMAQPRAALGTLLGRSRAESYRSQEFRILSRTLEADSAPVLETLRQLHNTKLELDLHYTLQLALRAWLYVHLPASIVLLGLVVLHIFFVLYF
jgi:hypothetical protein